MALSSRPEAGRKGTDKREAKKGRVPVGRKRVGLCRREQRTKERRTGISLQINAYIKMIYLPQLFSLSHSREASEGTNRGATPGIVLVRAGAT